MEKILIIRLRKLGDIIFTLPIVNLVRQAFPQVELDYLIEPEYSGIFKLFPNLRVNEIVVQRKLSLLENLKILNFLRSKKYDATIDLHSGPRAALFAWATRSPLRVGYNTPNRNWAYNVRFPRYHQPPIHSVFNQLQLLQPLRIDINQNPQFPSIEKSAFCNDNDKKFHLQQPYAVIHIGAGNDFRDWGEENFYRLLNRLKERGITVVLVGESQKEQKRAAQLADQKQIINFSGKLGYSCFINLISRAKVFIGVDSGPLHLASLTNTPLVALYGPNIVQISGPFRKEKVFILQKEMSCRPCAQRRCVYNQPLCLHRIEVEDVLEKVFTCL